MHRTCACNLLTTTTQYLNVSWFFEVQLLYDHESVSGPWVFRQSNSSFHKKEAQQRRGNCAPWRATCCIYTHKSHNILSSMPCTLIQAIWLRIERMYSRYVLDHSDQCVGLRQLFEVRQWHNFWILHAEGTGCAGIWCENWSRPAGWLVAANGQNHSMQSESTKEFNLSPVVWTQILCNISDHLGIKD